MNDYLITVNEVINLAPAGHYFDPKLLEPFILDGCEELKNNNCFGAEIYAEIFADMRAAVQFDTCADYTIGDVVIYGAKYYEAIADPPVGDLPTNASNWSEVDKFTSARFQSLWDRYLAQYLTFSVLQFAVPSVALRATTMGVMKNATDHSESASRDEVYTLKNDWENARGRRWNAMFNFLTFVSEDETTNNPELYPLFPANVEKCGKDCKPGESFINIPFV